MRVRKLWAFALVPAFLAYGSSTAKATYAYLVFTNGSTSTTSVGPGGTFSFQLQVDSPDSAASDGVTAVDYWLEASSDAVFTIQSRNTTTDGSAFGFTTVSDSSVTQTSNVPSLSTTGANNLTPAATGYYINGVNLGAGLTNYNDPAVQNRSAIVADYTISVASNATAGVYTLTAYTRGAGYSDTNSNDETFSSNGLYTVTVLPEPATAGLGIMVGLAALVRRPRKGLVLA